MSIGSAWDCMDEKCCWTKTDPLQRNETLVEPRLDETRHVTFIAKMRFIYNAIDRTVPTPSIFLSLFSQQDLQLSRLQRRSSYMSRDQLKLLVVLSLDKEKPKSEAGIFRIVSVLPQCPESYQSLSHIAKLVPGS